MEGWSAALQAVADFLFDERCHACDRPVDATARLPLPRHASAAALVAPLRVGFRRVGIDTRPLCRACCHALVPVTSCITVAAARADGPVVPAPGVDAPAAARPLSVWPAFDADRRILAIIHALKFARRERLAPWLARALACGLPGRALGGDDDRPDSVLVPVPMDRASLRRRGFNQAECLARAFGALAGVPVAPRVLVKTRATAPQSSLGRDERAGNVAGVFALASPDAVRGRRAVLVDDLVTTGATAAACAAVLWGAGAREVRVACVGYRP